ncbi:calcitonin gene-related peptide type 1 receptor-like isoform X2 [Diabrotica virgifera virgifera]|uniref:Calcitonin gene-related peptide type 1 receptor-like n=1 Tax=Diabrotica virgifera virgifera TaxID=50390 RepID=A0ABM5K443_DIAVI|nr:calcitonin gene-related peptide type 1 receptor-like isoform X2 [Diabrotica virgifera virgifera]XP_050504957.1 calcitonin gene-related peptide type 1 receptor-like isoform X2 [Diabrotica virgifera virgifera]XP_050504958.1 calcitonin gene-related peptide type 1 receptor-like isoform X2 [Diabrotica virgifera virgifera]
MNEDEIQQLNAIIEEKRLNCTSAGDFSYSNVLSCPVHFDGWSCWPETPAGTVANQSCPDFIQGFEPANTVYYKCEEDGSWYFHEPYNRTWVNYTTCVNTDDLSFRTIVIIIHSVGYSISLVALLISLALLIYFKTLRCARILIHMNLFASFAINNFLWLVWYYLMFDETEMLFANQAVCIALHTVLYTCLISNYSWMLCEGLYLHTVLVWAFISQRNLLKGMILIGWGIPLLTTFIYVPVRCLLGEGDELTMCWIKDSRFEIINQIPVAATIILNLFFLINIVRVVVMKLRKGPAEGQGSGASRSSLQALRATLLLVPLLGLNFLLTPFRPENVEPWLYFYDLISAVTTSFQGLCVAILFCFCNGEVQAQIKRKWSNVQTFRPRANSCSATTMSVRKVSASDYDRKASEVDWMLRMIVE